MLALSALALALVALTHLGADGDLLMLMPVLLVGLPLLAGRYVGEERLLGLASRAERPARGPEPALHAALLCSGRVLPRGGRLIATALAVRPPPATATA